MLPILGTLAGMAGRMALGTVASRVVAKAAASTFGGTVRVGTSGAARRRLRRMAVKRMARRRARGQRMQDAYGRFGTAQKRSRAIRLATSSQRQQAAQQAGGGFFGNQNPQQGFSSAGSGQMDTAQAQQAISQFGNALAKASLITGAFTGAIGVAVTAVKALQGFASVLVDSQRGTAKYSGTMSAAAAGLEVGRIGREMSQAGSTGDSFSRLTRSLDKLERAMQPFREMFTNLLNNGVTALIDAAAPLVDYFGKMLPSISKLGETIKDVYFLWEAGGNQHSADKLKEAYEQKEFLEELKQKKAAGRNFNDMIQLRVNTAIVNAVNKPAPGIPNQPIRGAGRQRRNPVNVPPIVNPFLLIQNQNNP